MLNKSGFIDNFRKNPTKYNFYQNLLKISILAKILENLSQNFRKVSTLVLEICLIFLKNIDYIHNVQSISIIS